MYQRRLMRTTCSISTGAGQSWPARALQPRCGRPSPRWWTLRAGVPASRSGLPTRSSTRPRPTDTQLLHRCHHGQHRLHPYRVYRRAVSGRPRLQHGLWPGQHERRDAARRPVRRRAYDGDGDQPGQPKQPRSPGGKSPDRGERFPSGRATRVLGHRAPQRPLDQQLERADHGHAERRRHEQCQGDCKRHERCGRHRVVTWRVNGPVGIATIPQPATATVGSSIADKATVSGGINPTRTVTFNLYNNPNGTGPALFTDTRARQRYGDQRRLYGHGDRDGLLGRYLQRRPQQQPGDKRHSSRAGDDQPGRPDDHRRHARPGERRLRHAVQGCRARGRRPVAYSSAGSCSKRGRRSRSPAPAAAAA